MSIIQTKAQKRCGKRDHSYVVNTGTGEIVTGCLYCKYNPGMLAVGTMSRPMHWMDVATRGSVVLALLAMAYVLSVCGAWLGGAL